MNELRLQPQIIGEGLRKLRLSKNITLETVAAATGLTKGFLSLVETGRRNINAKDLQALLTQYDSSSALFISLLCGRGAEPEVIVQKSKNMLLLDGKHGERGCRVLLARPVGTAHEPEITVVDIAPQSLLTSDYTIRHGTIQGYVIAGTLLIEFKGDEAVARAGDEFMFDGRRHHLFRNFTEEPTKYVQFFLPE
ncbi:cupin domain-containing protein [Ignavibacteria bacterium]|nr:helix-turn-helix transcriptional regulator [Bacteroidota bacterium]